MNSAAMRGTARAAARAAVPQCAALMRPAVQRPGREHQVLCGVAHEMKQLAKGFLSEELANSDDTPAHRAAAFRLIDLGLLLAAVAENPNSGDNLARLLGVTTAGGTPAD